MEVLHQIKGVFVLDLEGKRLFSKYFGELKNHLEYQKKLESSLFHKTQKQSAIDILLYDKQAVVVKLSTDLYFYVVGTSDDNELILSEVLETLVDVLDTLFGGQMEKRTLLENFDLLVLSVDEILEDGIILDLDSNGVASRVGNSDHGGGMVDGKKDILSQVLGHAGESFKKAIWGFGGN